ncbi:MAG: hypothetical protein DA330_00390 [Nitrososphaera sp.]|nr:hypothetical protein [Nitrososphaera sp.]
MPIFQLGSLVDSLSELGFICRTGEISDVSALHRPYFERWLSQRDGFITMEKGSINYIGIEEVVRMGPFFNVYCLVENDHVADNDDNAHNLLDASLYYRLCNGKATNLGWSGGILSSQLAKDQELSRDLASNIMKEEVKRINVKARDYCCVIETGVWDPEGLTSVFGMVDRIGTHTRQLMAQVHFGEDVNI